MEGKMSKELLYYNGFGGFSKSQNEYIIKSSEKTTVVPWSHIIANENFGTLVTSSGGGYTWHGNSRENKLTSWSNDMVNDEPSEQFFVRHLENNKTFSCTPRNNLYEYEIHFGFGYAKFIFENEDIKMELLEFVPLNKNEKNFSLEIENKSVNASNYEISFIANPVLGVCKEFSAKHLKFFETKHGYEVRNTYREIYKSDRVFFELKDLGAENGSTEMFNSETEKLNMEMFDSSKNKLEVFISETYKNIVSDDNNLYNSKINLTTKVHALPNEKKKIVGRIWICDDERALGEKTEEYSKTENAELEKIKKFWEEKTEKIKVYSPVDSFNIMMNGWLLYQTLACRMWAKTSFYQAGGAFGFRDQLQDSLMFLNIEPAITKKQIIYHAEHQSKEGDVLHWWHAEKNNGTRTRFTDDLLWLPYAISKYIEVTHDYAILDEKIAFVEGRKLEENEDEIYIETTKSKEKASLYDHAKLAIEKSFSFGEHGLPQMGSGDWNDGMNNVKGESVWLGFFLYKILIDFSKLCDKKQDEETSIIYRTIADELKKKLNTEGWDGKWYRRAFFEDSTLVGSEASAECKIDSITQSFSVISGAGEIQKCIDAMKNLDNFLVDRENQIIKLLTPPFSKCEKNPGYIKSYIPGVRENGGQYTHGCCC